jgi:hypothetical protein
MFDYSTLASMVRRTSGDYFKTNTDTTDSLSATTNRIVLENEGEAIISSVTIDDIEYDSSEYSVEGNIVTFVNQIESGSSVSIVYKICNYSDEEIIENIGDSVLLVETLLNRSLGFSGTQTADDIDFNIKTLLVNATVLQMAGIDLSGAAGDAIYIKDGDTTIDTSYNSSESVKKYRVVLEKFNIVLAAVRGNLFKGQVR